MKTEDRIQQEIVQKYRNTFCLAHHSPRCIVYHIPNQNQQHLVKIGVLSGVADLEIIHATKLNPIGTHLYFEVKTSSGTQTDAQKAFQSQIEALGGKYYLVRSVEEFWGVIMALP